MYIYIIIYYSNHFIYLVIYLFNILKYNNKINTIIYKLT